MEDGATTCRFVTELKAKEKLLSANLPYHSTTGLLKFVWHRLSALIFSLFSLNLIWGCKSRNYENRLMPLYCILKSLLLMYCLADPISGFFLSGTGTVTSLIGIWIVMFGYSFCISNKSSYRLSGNRLLSSIYCIVYSFRNSYLYYNRYRVFFF